MVNKNLIKLPKSAIVIIVVAIVSLFVLIVCISNKSTAKYIEADFNTEIKPTELNGSETYGILRGGLFYEKNKFLSTSAKFIFNNSIDKNIWESHGPLIDFNNNPHHYTLDDLSLPYIISKQADSDTIIVIKNGIPLKFTMDLTQD
jgi:hypothetical protein